MPLSTTILRLASSIMALALVLSLFSSPSVASPIPDDGIPQVPLDLGLRASPDPKDNPIDGLPVKLYVHAGPNCHSERTHLYYLPENVCIGPLYHPAGSFKLLSGLPTGCYIRGFDSGHCLGDDVKVNREDRFTGPQPKGLCANLDTGFRRGKNEEEVWEGINSLVVDCGRYGV